MTVTLQLLVTFYLNDMRTSKENESLMMVTMFSEQKWNEILLKKDQVERTCKILN